MKSKSHILIIQNLMKKLNIPRIIGNILQITSFQKIIVIMTL